MKSFSPLAIIGSAVAVTAAYSPFMVEPLTTHQPVGNNEGQTNYYHISFTVNSENGAADNSTGTCAISWGDNSWTSKNAYSENVPTGDWIACGSSEFSFQLFPYFSIGNFSLAVQQNFTDASTSQQMLANGSIHITNTTASRYSCDIIGSEVEYIQHAHGDCSIPASGSRFAVPVATAAPIPECRNPRTVRTSFAATYDSKRGQHMYLVGSLPALGSWDPSSAILMSSDGAASWPTYGVTLDLPSGSRFQYKYILQDVDDSETWECCENRSASTPTHTCGEVSVGDYPDYFRGGGTPVVVL